MGTTDCGLSSIEAINSQKLRVTFVPDGGSAVPLESDALQAALWGISINPVDANLVIVLVEKISSYVYDVSTNHKMLPYGSWVELRTDGIATDLGGYCDSPEVKSVRSVANPMTKADFFGYDPNTYEYGPVTFTGEPLYQSVTSIRTGRSRRKY